MISPHHEAAKVE